MGEFLKAMLISVCSIAVFMSFEMNAEAYSGAEASYSLQIGNNERNTKGSSRELVYYKTVKEAGTVLREGMKAREKTIQIGYTTKKKLNNSIMNEFMEEALKHTGVPTEGDYLKAHYLSYQASAKGTVQSGVYNWVFTYTVKYRTTADQEKATDKKVDEILKELKLDGKDTYSKIKLIYDYMSKNITYDWQNANKSDKLKHSAYAAAVKKKCVCQGYCSLLYRLLLENGIDNRIITGTSDGKAHGWNIVKIDGKYYYLDVTFDSASGAYHEWFLKGSDNFKNHKAKDEYTTSAFKKNYPLSKKQYVYSKAHDHECKTTVTKATLKKDGKIVKKCIICDKVISSKVVAKVATVKLSSSVYTYNNKTYKPNVTVKGKDGKVLKQGTDYKVTYAAGRKNVGKYTVKITLNGNYSGSKNLYFEIRPMGSEVTNVKAESKGFTVKYREISTQISGYEIQYSAAGNFENAKSALVKNNKTVSVKIKGQKANKKYFVRIRTYKTVESNGKSVKIYSAWSESKSVKTKK